MKKMFSVLAALCMLMSAVSAPAETVPSFDEMPSVVMEDDNTVVEEASFEGEWVPDKAFLGTEYVTLEQLSADYGFVFGNIRIAGGEILQDFTDENGETTTTSNKYVFEAGQLQSLEDDPQNFAVELLENGNIVVSLFVPAEEEGQLQCISVFMVRAAE